METTRRIRRHCRIGAAYVAQMLKTRLEYRGDFLIECLASVLTQGCGLLVVGIIFESIPLLKGWSRAEVFFIFGFAIAAQALSESFTEGIYWLPDKYILRGELDRLLLRPLDPLFQLLLENFNFQFVPDLVLGLGILAIAAVQLGLGIGVLQVALFLLMLGSAVLVIAGVFVALSSVSFWIEDKVGLLPPVYNLLGFARYPLTIYHPALRALLSWVLPYGFVAFYPSAGFLGRGEFRALFWATPLAGLAAFGVGYAVFRAGIRRYRSTGS
jgi:ABC-2 type transport system permease protein